ncbi:hypothetical protein B0H16DRAFT_1458689 [Mycena metata]|uniref:Uncharacterized protein n=1 Tax=Mycena metata TaxID=1033252 RepID=A0AAD7NDG1_9AGAR|nr:hypothetical protein B0H16DRAFT_1458689 [Mycena metata]
MCDGSRGGPFPKGMEPDAGAFTLRAADAAVGVEAAEAAEGAGLGFFCLGVRQHAAGQRRLPLGRFVFYLGVRLVAGPWWWLIVKPSHVRNFIANSDPPLAGQHHELGARSGDVVRGSPSFPSSPSSQGLSPIEKTRRNFENKNYFLLTVLRLGEALAVGSIVMQCELFELRWAKISSSHESCPKALVVV